MFFFQFFKIKFCDLYFWMNQLLNSVGRRVAKLAVRLLATAALWVRIQTSLKNTKWAT